MRTSKISMILVLILTLCVIGCANTAKLHTTLNIVSDSCESQYVIAKKLNNAGSISDEDMATVKSAYNTYRSSVIVYKEQYNLKISGQSVDLSLSLVPLNDAITNFLDVVADLTNVDKEE